MATILEELETANHAVEAWNTTKAQAPTTENLTTLAQDIEAAKSLYTASITTYRIAAVKRALSFGWVEVARELGILPRTLHSWHKDYCPELEDNLKTYTKSLAKQEKLRTRLAEQKKAAESEARLIEQLIGKEEN